MIIYTRPHHTWMWYPYIILSVTDPSSLSYVGRDVRSIIIDVGVHKIFKELKLQEYPGGYERWVYKVTLMYYVVKGRGVHDVRPVIPDYPSDYPENPVKDNISKTIRNIEYALDNYPQIPWIIPIQGSNDSPRTSVAKCVEELMRRGLLRSDYVAIASTCVTRSSKLLYELAKIGRALLKDKKIHMFGTTMKAWKLIDKYIDSTDTVNHSLMCKEALGKMCSNVEEYVIGWKLFLDKLLKMEYITKEDYERAINSLSRKS